MKKTIACLMLLCFLAVPITAHAFGDEGFSFSKAEEAEKREDEAKARQIVQDLSTPCRESLKGRKIAVLVGERHSGGLAANQKGHGLLFRELNGKLKDLGLRTYTQAQINAQIADAEAKAILNNDHKAAIAAASKLGASFFLKGVISTRANQTMSINVKGAQMNVNEVAVTLMLTLSDSQGRTLSRINKTGQSWAGADTLGVALQVVQDQGASAVAKLYKDYCTKAGK